MHAKIEGYRLPEGVRRVAIVGLRPAEFRRAAAWFLEHGIEAIDGGSIDDGSNMARKTRAAASRADVVFLKVRFARTLKPEDLEGRVVVHFSGTARLKEMLDQRR